MLNILLSGDYRHSNCSGMYILHSITPTETTGHAHRETSLTNVSNLNAAASRVGQRGDAREREGARACRHVTRTERPPPPPGSASESGRSLKPCTPRAASQSQHCARAVSTRYYVCIAVNAPCRQSFRSRTRIARKPFAHRECARRARAHART